MSPEDAKMYLHSMIFSHFNNSITSWSQAAQSAKNHWNTCTNKQLELWIKENQDTTITM